MKKLRLPSAKSMAPVATFLYNLFRYGLLICISYIILYPIFRMLTGAITLPLEQYTGNTGILPDDPTFGNFKHALTYYPYMKYVKKTVTIVLVCTALTLISTSLVGYGLGRYKFKGSGLIFLLVVFTIIMPVQCAVIPMYYEYRFFNIFGIGEIIGWFTGKPLTVNLLPNNTAMYVSALFGVGLNSGIYIFLFKQFFASMPKDLEEAAKLDGCGPFRTFLRVMIPNITPVIVTVCLLSIVYYWNDTLLTGVFTRKEEGFTLMLALEELQDTHYLVQGSLDATQVEVERYAIMLMIIAPLMIVFIACQKFFVECMDRSGSKG